MKSVEAPIPFSGLNPSQQETFSRFVAQSDAGRIGLVAAGAAFASTEISEFPGGKIRITRKGSSNDRVIREIQIAKGLRSPFREVDLTR